MNETIRIEIQIEFLQNYFNTVNIKNDSTKAKMSHVDVEKIRKLIKTKKSDGEYRINHNFTVVLKNGNVTIKDTE